jgi:adenosyl cobinamide kinase/adenosyl cobinamide phosphate guanylyltransferase
MTPDNQARAQHWRALEADAMVAAAEADDEISRGVLVNILMTYENLALRAEASAITTTSVLTKED